MKSQQDFSNKIDAKRLNKTFNGYSIVNRIEQLYNYFSEDKIVFTSSFGSNAAYLLHLVSRIKPNQKVHFIDTGFHFRETIEYKKQISRLLDIEVVDVLPDEDEHRLAKENELWKKDPDSCCHLNKVKPMERLKDIYKVWISGLMRHQTGFRSGLQLFEDKDGILKFHPLFDQDRRNIKEYLEYFNLPIHPLVSQGYGSIGCTHCTQKGEGRSGRWKGLNKTECGLHPGFFEQKLKEKEISP